MTNKKRQYAAFVLLFIVLGSITVTLNRVFPAAVGGLYAQGKTDFLKKITLTEENKKRPLDYYIGRVEDLWVGPLTSVISGGLFVLFCVWFLQGAGALRFWGATMLYLILSRFQVLFYPPYGDGLFGVLSEPLWLIRHHLDWIGLVQQDSFIQTGPQMYPESFYPKLVALLLYFSPSPKFFLVVNHLIVFAAGAALVTALREILRELFDPDRATLGALLCLALPIIQCHVELLNMEIVCSCFAVLCLLMALRRNFFMASAMAVFSMMVKVPGAITTIVLFGACLLSGFSGCSRKKILANAAWVLGACAVALLLAVIRRVTMGEQPAVFRPSFLAGLRDMKSLTVFWLFLFLSCVYLGRFLFVWILRRNEAKTSAAFLNEHYKGLVVFLGAASWFLLYINSPTIIPRYVVLGIPCAVVFFVYLFARFIPRENIYRNSMVVMILFAFLCSHGLLSIHQKESGENNAPEGSLEYRNVLKVHMRAAQEIEKNYSGYTIGAYCLMAQLLTYREAGYVNKPLKDVFVYGYGATHEGIRPYPGLKNIDILKTIWVAQTDGDPDYLSKYPIGASDKIIQEIWAGDKRMTLFMGGFSVEAVARAVLGY